MNQKALTPAMKRLIEMENQKRAFKKFYEEFDKVCAEVVSEIGLGTYFEDDKGTVYALRKPTTYISYHKEQEIIRTRVEGEKQGTIAEGTAKDARSQDLIPFSGKVV